MPSSEQVIDRILRPLFTSMPQMKQPFHSPDDIPDCPFGVVRHTPSGKLIGDFRIFQAMETENGRVDIANLGGASEKLSPQATIWEIAYNLSPGWRGQGLGGELLGAIIESWVSWVNIEKLMAVSTRFLTKACWMTK